MNQPLQVTISLAQDWDALLPLLALSTYTQDELALRRIFAIERAKGTEYFIAHAADGQILGYIGLFYNPSGEVRHLFPAEIMDVAVYPAYRQLGIGQKLVRHALQVARQSGCPQVWVHTDPALEKVLEFYRQLGFQLIGILPDGWSIGADRAVLRYDFTI